MAERQPIAANRLILETGRLILRPFRMEDAPRVQELAAASEIADTTLNIPHPYPEGAAEAWIATHADGLTRGSYVFAVTVRQTADLIGCIGLHCTERWNSAEIGYWIGVPYWGAGYCTEGVRRVIEFGFDELELNRIYASYFTRNPASLRVQQKAGMVYEGTQRQAVRKGERYEDLGLTGITRDVYEADRR